MISAGWEEFAVCSEAEPDGFSGKQPEAVLYAQRAVGLARGVDYE